MLPTLIAKDLRRAMRNPVPYLVQLGVPLLMTALLGAVFGGSSPGEGGLGRIRVALVDEEDSLLGRLVRGAGGQGAAGRHLDVEVLPRDEALRRVTDNRASAALIIPDGFTRDYLAGRSVALTLVKNPAQSIHPAVVEELLATGTTLLDAVQRNFQDDLALWNGLFSSNRNPGWAEVANAVEASARRLGNFGERLGSLPVWYRQEFAASTDSATASTPRFNLFAFLLPGLAAMFLLFLADIAMRDLTRETQQGTFQRFCTLPPGPAVFVASKFLFTFVVVVLGAVILLGGGSLLFGIAWRAPGAMIVLTLTLSLFCAGLLAFLAAVLGSGRRVEVFNGVVLMLLGLVSGCAFPAQSLPAWLRDQVTPLMPPAWFVGAVRSVQFDDAGAVTWLTASAKLAATGLLLGAVAAWGFRRRLRRGTL